MCIRDRRMTTRIRTVLASSSRQRLAYEATPGELVHGQEAAMRVRAPSTAVMNGSEPTVRLADSVCIRIPSSTSSGVKTRLVRMPLSTATVVDLQNS